MDSLTVIFLLLVPGFVALEVSNFFTARANNRLSEQQRLFGTALLGGLVLFGYAASNGTSLKATVDGFTDLNRVNEFALLWLLITGVGVGVAWGLFKTVGVWMLYQLWQWVCSLVGAPAYLGYRPVMDYAVAKMSGRWVTVFMLDGRFFIGSAEVAADVEGDRALLLEAHRQGWEEVDEHGRPTGGVRIEDYPEAERPFMYVPAEQIKFIRITPPNPKF